MTKSSTVGIIIAVSTPYTKQLMQHGMELHCQLISITALTDDAASSMPCLSANFATQFHFSQCFASLP